jgi:hypothetical protein
MVLCMAIKYGFDSINVLNCITLPKINTLLLSALLTSISCWIRSWSLPRLIKTKTVASSLVFQKQLVDNREL